MSPSTRIERNVFSCRSTNEVAELNAKSAWAARSPVGSVWPARTCVVSSSGPCLIHDFYRRQPLSIRFGHDTSGAHGFAWRAPCSYRIESNGTGGRAPRSRASADIGTSAGGPSAWLRDVRFPLPGTHRSRRPASRRSAWPASAQRTVTLRAGAANPAEAARRGRGALNESPAAVGEVSGGRAEPVGSGACGGRFDSVTGWQPREG